MTGRVLVRRQRWRPVGSGAIPPRLATALLLGPLTVGATSCAGLNCTEIGGTNGVSVGIPEALFVQSGTVAVEVCDEDGCAMTAQRLGRLRRPVGRGAEATFDDLGRSFAPGTVEVRVELRVELRDEAGALVASTVESTTLERSFPNGKACDGDGYVSGSVDLGVEDRVDVPGR